MNIINPRLLKGFRDFLPKEALKREKVINLIKESFELFGFDPLETPSLEYADILMGKYGEEADKLLYLFKDKGERLVGLRYDQTVPLARVIAQYKNNLPIPFKRYQIQLVWRAENPQKGRFREFTQCDIDIVGEENLLADCEIIACALSTLKKLGFKKSKMLINDRFIFEKLEKKYIASIDKLEKIGEEKVIDELNKKGLSVDKAKDLLKKIKKAKKTALIEKLFSLLEKFGFKEEIDFQFSPTLARGLDYYTSTIFEVVDENYPFGSLGGGGRYDNLIGQFTGKKISAVGFAFGFDRLIEAIDYLNLIDFSQTKTKVLITIFSEELKDTSLSLAFRLRSQNIKTEVYLNEKTKLEKQLKYADKKNIPYVLIIGPEEKKNQEVILKNMKDGKQRKLKEKELVELLKK